MYRLTQRNDNGVSMTEGADNAKIAELLCDYEELEMTPSEIDEMRLELFELKTSFENDVSIQHVLELLEAEKEGRLTIRKKQTGKCCGQCHHFLREPQRASGVCEVRKYKNYPLTGTPLYCCQSKKACLDFEERGERPVRYQGGQK